MILWIIRLDGCDTPELKVAVLNLVIDHCDIYGGPHSAEQDCRVKRSNANKFFFLKRAFL